MTSCIYGNKNLVMKLFKSYFICSNTITTHHHSEDNAAAGLEQPPLWSVPWLPRESKVFHDVANTTSGLRGS